MSLLATIAATAVAALPAPAEVRLIVQEQPGADATAAVHAAGGRVERTIPLIDGLVVRLPATAADRLSAAPAVRAVSPDAPVARTAQSEFADDLASAYNQSIGAPKAWARGVTGKGIGVAVIDSGIQGDLPDFRVSPVDPRSRVIVNAVVHPDSGSGGDGYGHGTHVAGLIAGNGFARSLEDPVRGRYVGVAPQAALIAIKAGDEDGDATVLDVIDGLQFAVDNRTRYGIRVVNLSLSSQVAESHLTDPLDAAVEAAWRAGLVVVAAAGNRADDADAVSYAPGNDPWVITVGAVDDQGTKQIADDVLASWSSRGVTQDGHAKPDVVAPGARLVSTVPPGAAYRALCPACVVDGEYFRAGGTSMAAAVVSGAVADILQAHPDWTPDEVKRAISDTSSTDGEIALDRVLTRFSNRPPAPANAGLPTSQWLDPATGGFDYARTSLTRADWAPAESPLDAPWALVGWMRTSLTAVPFDPTGANCIELERTSLTRTSLTRTSLTGADLAAATVACEAAAAVDPARTSLTRTSLTWASSFAK
jgi:serine protease AprX